MSSEEKDVVIRLIKLYFEPAKRVHRNSSYWLKSIFERAVDCYISNEEFKKLMLEAGFTPTKKSSGEINNYYWLRVKEMPMISSHFWGYG